MDLPFIVNRLLYSAFSIAESVSDTSVWTHYLTVGIPKGANFTHKDAAFMYIGGGSKTSR